MSLQPLPHSSGELVPAGLTAQDQRRIQDALDNSKSANTRRAYNQAWRRFEAWMKIRGPGHSLPATPELVAAFLAEERELSVATIRLHKAALAAIHRSTGHGRPDLHERVRRVMGGIARSRARAQRQAKPLNAEALAAVTGRRPLGPERESGRSPRQEPRDAERGPGPPVRAAGRAAAPVRGGANALGGR